MKEVEIENNADRSRLIYFLLSIATAISSFLSENSFVYIPLAFVLIAYSQVEKANNEWLRVAGIITYIIYFVWFVFQAVSWFHSSFIE